MHRRDVALWSDVTSSHYTFNMYYVLEARELNDACIGDGCLATADGNKQITRAALSNFNKESVGIQ